LSYVLKPALFAPCFATSAFARFQMGIVAVNTLTMRQLALQQVSRQQLQQSCMQVGFMEDSCTLPPAFAGLALYLYLPASKQATASKA
jgi:hypothetical protein